MEKNKWTMVNSENVKPFVCDETYSSKMLTGDEMAGLPVMNINEGTLVPGRNTGGGAHEETEIYFVLSCGSPCYVWLDDERLSVKNGDIIVIPPHVIHWIENEGCDQPFKLMTFWSREEQNETALNRRAAWGTTMAYFDGEYQEKRLKGEKK